MNVVTTTNRAVSPALRVSVMLIAALYGVASAGQGTSGEVLYRNHCAACHGRDASGNGPAAVAMKATVPTLRSLAARNGGIFPGDAVAEHIDGRQRPPAHGSMQMPVWGDIFAAPRNGGGHEVARERIAAVVDYLATLQD